MVTLFQGWPGWKIFLLDACFVQSQFWFIPYLVQCYLVYWIISRCFSHYWVIAFLVIGFIALNTLPQIEAEQSFSFFAGVLASRHIDFLRRLSHSQLLSFGLASMLCGILFLLLKEIPAVHAYKGTVPYNYILLFIKLPLAVPLILCQSFSPSCSHHVFYMALASLHWKSIWCTCLLCRTWSRPFGRCVCLCWLSLYAATSITKSTIN